MPATRRSLRLSASIAACAALLSWAVAAAPAKPDDAMTQTLAGEFALQAGDIDSAARWYLQAARSASGDAGLAERATRIALLANDSRIAADALDLWRKRAPRTLGMRGAEATLAMRQGKTGDALRGIESLLRDPGKDGWRYALGALDGGKDDKRAAKVLGSIIDDGAIPQNLQAWLAFGGFAQRIGSPALAERIVGEVVRRFPGEPRVALLRAAQLREAGKPDDARKVLAEASDAALLLPDLRLGLAAEYDALGDPVAAAGVMAKGPQDEDSYAVRAALLDKAGDKAALGALYDELKRDATRPDPARFMLLGQIAESLERNEEALTWYRSVPGGEQRWPARIRSDYVLHELKRGTEAYSDLRAIQADASADDDARRGAYLAEAELKAKDHDDAAEQDAYARGLGAFPDDPALLYARSLSWERRDDIAKAEADLRRILVAEPDNVAALNALGYTLADRTTRYREALALIDRARAADPDNAAIIDSYGWVLYRLGRNGEALTELRRAFGLQKDPEIAAHLGEVLWVQGEKDEARRFFDESKRLQPDDNRALQRALEKTGA
ncbi:tetratricopeptide repeat protein [Pseudoluteimonas lycopersici]|uniref:Tetratricopeptide repeat protein n=1 Tax=Pseudoluteimonas lycopersici TaxID=1324796 RepID=A0A516V815_9GAMM|nr:tetratricopeptide repeat protein [Lysobacter lycopersici]QDQ74673.1 tetratricopeptide repeat protein [Lysobacter lycopersici]